MVTAEDLTRHARENTTLISKGAEDISHLAII